MDLARDRSRSTVERRAIEENVWAECVERVRELEEALYRVMERAWHSRVLEKELSEVRGNLKRSEVLSEGWDRQSQTLRFG